MMRSMFSGVSGLKAHQAKMDVIGNNIANVNTVGYKGQTVTFQEVFSQTIRGAGSPDAGGGRGGTNPQSIGLGVNIASMDVIHTQGSTQRTDNPTDLMIDGNGFFVVSNDGGQNRYYTRAGNFTVDVNGNLVTPGGMKVLGLDGSPIVIDKSQTMVAQPSGPKPVLPLATPPVVSGTMRGDEWAMNGNISINEATYTTTATVYDSLGATHKVSIGYGAKAEMPGEPGVYYREVIIKQVGGDTSTTPASDLQIYPPLSGAPPTYTPVYAIFNTDGTFRELSGVAIAAGPPPTATLDPVDANTNVVLNLPGADYLMLPLTQGTAGKSNLFANVTSNNSLSNVSATQKYGNAPGSIDNFNISAKGEVEATYTNGQKSILATIALAGFDNPAGLRKMGANLFVATSNSGDERMGVPGAGSFGTLAPGALEMSNVDLSQQFTEMITTQRGFQANAKIITTSDEILQELVNLKR